MKWVNTLSRRASLEAAIDEVVEQAREQLSESADLGLLFISSAFASEYARLMPLLHEKLEIGTLIGCSGGGIIGMNTAHEAEELEEEPALSLTLAHLPEVQVHGFHLDGEALPDLDSPPDRWMECIGVSAADRPQFVILADPFSAKINDLLAGLDFAYPGATKVGGLASSGAGGNTTALFCNRQMYREGSVGVALSGNLVLESIVAQGCRAIGQPYRVKECDRNIILQLEDVQDRSAPVTPLDALRELIQSLDPSGRELAQHSLFVGVARDEFKLELERGDFLIRNLLGVDPRVGAIAIGDRIRPGQRIQFHLRDAHTSAEDLEMLLERYKREIGASSSSPRHVGALLFSCLGRGARLYGEAHFDSRLFLRYFDIPLGGFFCNGEIGPVGDGTFLHGYTSVFGICRQP
jgi:small ligand-binding sensory domain FIST